MTTKLSGKKFVPPLSAKIREISYELQGIAYLIGNQKNDELPPFDLQESYYGIGRILARITRQLRKLSDRAENIE